VFCNDSVPQHLSRMEIWPLNQRYKVDSNQKIISPPTLCQPNPTGYPPDPETASNFANQVRSPQNTAPSETHKSRPIISPAVVQNYVLLLPSKPAVPRPIPAVRSPPPAPATWVTHQVEAGELLLASPLNHARLSSASMQRTDSPDMHMHPHPQQMKRGGGKPKARPAPK
jgi:hypothetical protein